MPVIQWTWIFQRLMLKFLGYLSVFLTRLLTPWRQRSWVYPVHSWIVPTWLSRDSKKLLCKLLNRCSPNASHVKNGKIFNKCPGNCFSFTSMDSLQWTKKKKNLYNHACFQIKRSVLSFSLFFRRNYLKVWKKGGVLVAENWFSLKQRWNLQIAVIWRWRQERT